MNTNNERGDQPDQYQSMTYSEFVKAAVESSEKRKKGNLNVENFTTDADAMTFFSQGHLPSQLELVQIAAALKHGESIGEFNPEAAINCAMDLWNTAHNRLLKEHLRIEGDLASMRRFVGRNKKYLHKPLKIGSHYLPALDDDEFLSPAIITFDKLLTTVTGLSRKEDQMAWFRSFLVAEYRLRLYRKEHPDPLSELGVSYVYDSFNGYKYPTAEESTIPANDKTVENVIAALRENGIESRLDRGSKSFNGELKLFRSRLMLAIQYRIWRLTMRTPKERAQKIYKLKDCVKKGLEWSEKLNDCIRDDSE